MLSTLKRLAQCVLIVGLLTAASADSQPAPFSWAPLYALNQKRTVLIRVESATEPTDYGSGIVVGPLGLILTAKHLLGSDPKQAVVSGLLDWTEPSVDFSKAMDLEVLYVSRDLDFAVLRAAAGTRMPRGIELERTQSTGEPVMLMGYPSGGNLMSTFGYVSGNAGEGRFASDVHAGGGNSGGPVISARNALLGLLIEKNRRNDDGTIELSFALSSAAILKDIASVRGGSILVATRRTGTQMSWPGAETASAPSLISIAYGFDDTKDDHPVFLAPHRKTYRYVKQAQPGYLITSVRVIVEHRNHVVDEPSAQIRDGGRTLSVTYTLESGPTIDQWRGWIDGRVETTQQRQGGRE